MNRTFVILGKFFYRYRSLIALPFFLLLMGLSEPGRDKVVSHILIGFGIILRIWAAGYIGEKARGREITAEFRIDNKPYHIFRHPLYLGNFFLVVGTIFLYNPVLWFSLLLVIIFIFEYSMIIVAEESSLRGLPRKKVVYAMENLKGEVSTIITVLFIYVIHLFRGIL